MKIPILIEAMSYVDEALIAEADSYMPAPKRRFDWKEPVKFAGLLAACLILALGITIVMNGGFKGNEQLDRMESIESDYGSFYGVVLEIEEHSMLIERRTTIISDKSRPLYRIYTYDLDEDDIPYVEVGNFVRVRYRGTLYGEEIKVPELVTEIVSAEEYRKYYEGY